jgi:uncharacterized membrane protein HdeD (DUF308 family)
MEVVDTRLRRALRRSVHILGHAATIALGVVLLILGIGLTMTVVFATFGIVTAVVGVSLVVGGLFAHTMAGP